MLRVKEYSASTRNPEESRFFSSSWSWLKFTLPTV